MASVTFSVDTIATGLLPMSFNLSEEHAQRMFAALVGSAAPITDVRTVPDPNDPSKTIKESYQRPRTLDEALRDKVNALINEAKAFTIAYEEAQARAAIAVPAALELMEKPNYLLDESWTIPYVASGVGTIHQRAVSPGPGTLQYYNGPLSFSSGGRLDVRDTNLACAELANRSRLAGRMYKFVVTIKSPFTQALTFGLGDINTPWFVQAPSFPSIEFKTGVVRVQRGDGKGVIVDGEPAADMTYDYFIIERLAGGFIIRRDGGDYRLLYIDGFAGDNVDCCLQFRNGGGSQYMEQMAVAEIGYLPTPLASHSFSETDTSTIPVSDGAGSAETGGSGLTPTVSGDVRVAAQRLEMASDGSGYVVWETGRADVFASGKLTPVDGSPVALVIAYVDVDNMWLAEIDSSTELIKIIERTGGVETTRATGNLATDPAPGTIDAGTEYPVMFRRHGASLRAIIDETASLHSSSITFASSAHAAATKCGVRVTKGTAVASSKARNIVVFPEKLTDFVQI